MEGVLVECTGGETRGLVGLTDATDQAHSTGSHSYCWEVLGGVRVE